MSPRGNDEFMSDCCLCSSKAVAVFDMPGGCVARPDLLVQPLCMHHVRKATPLGGMHLRMDLTVDNAFTREWEAGRV